MTVRELIERLEEANPDAEVRWAAQPNYPFEYSISEIVSIDMQSKLELEIEAIQQSIADDHGAEPMSYNEMLEIAKDNIEHEGGKDVVYLGEGSQIGYLPCNVKYLLGW